MIILNYTRLDNTFMSQWQRIHFYDELKRYNCKFLTFNINNFDSVDAANEALKQYINKKNIDLFMTGLFNSDIYPETVEYIKKKGIPSLLLCYDNLTIPYKYMPIAKYFDYVWITEPDTKYIFDRYSIKTHFQPYAANPFYFKPNWSNTEIEEICFIGTPYGTRTNIINHLLKSEVPVSLFSNKSAGRPKQSINMKNYNKQVIFNFLRFPIGRKIISSAIKNKDRGKHLNKMDDRLTWNTPVAFEEMSQIYSSYALSLSTSSARNTEVLKKPVDIVFLRNFEISMCGGLQFCRYTDKQSSYFEDEKEIIFYHNDEEMIDKGKFYLKPSNSCLRLKMKKAARKRAEREHTWFVRFNKVFRDLGLTNYGRK